MSCGSVWCVFAGLVLTIALNFAGPASYKLVVSTYKVTLVAAFVPLCAGLFWSRATTQGALCAFVAGLITWMGLELFGPSDSIWPPQLVGFLVAATGMVVGSLLPQKIGTHRSVKRLEHRDCLDCLVYLVELD